jgi:hypothetical protein
MPDNSNPKMKHALYFHRNKNQAPTSIRKSRQTEPVGGQTYNLLAGKKQRNSSFLNNFWREKKETTTTTTTECDWSEGAKDRTPSFVRNADASTYWGRRCTIGYKKIRYRAESPRITRTCVLGSRFATGKEGNKIYAQLICLGQGRKTKHMVS